MVIKIQIIHVFTFIILYFIYKTSLQAILQTWANITEAKCKTQVKVARINKGIER